MSDRDPMCNRQLYVINMHHKVKMVGHQAPCQHIGVRQNMFLNFIKEEQVVLPVKEDSLAVIALVINVV